MSVRLTIECEEHELRSKLYELLYGDGRIQAGSTQRPSDQNIEGSWSPEDAERLYLNVQPDARRMIRALFDSYPDGLTWDDWQNAVGLRGVNFGGSRSSIGHQHNRFPGRPDPIVWINERYVLEQSFAEALRAILPSADTAPNVTELRDRAARADREEKPGDAFLESFAEKAGIDPNEYETWVEVVELIIEKLQLDDGM